MSDATMNSQLADLLSEAETALPELNSAFLMPTNQTTRACAQRFAVLKVPSLRLEPSEPLKSSRSLP